ncbi:MAG: transposase [Nitrospirae bacterium]|nr:transposase [Nitrospirota bacterium]
MANILNYKYEIFPTRPQRYQLNRILRESRIQWNKAVTIRKKLKTALLSGQIKHVVNACLSSDKKARGKRPGAIKKFQDENPSLSVLDLKSTARLYDVKNLVGKLIDINDRCFDANVIIQQLKDRYLSELNARKEAKAQGTDGKKLPKLPTYWKLIGAINNYAGYAAKTYMDDSFKSPRAMTLSPVRFNISGSAEAKKWNTACNPSKEQRAYGATGDPRYKRRCEGFASQTQNTNTNKLILKRNKSGHVIVINALPDGMRQVPIAYHRPIPDGSKIKTFTVNAKAGRFFAVLSCEVPDSAWQIAPMNAGWHAGIDPGASTSLTVALRNSQTNELAQFEADWKFLKEGKVKDKLEKMQQALSRKSGPTRNRTEEEIQDALKNFSTKSAIKKLASDEREKEIAKKEKWLRSTKVRNVDGMSKRWRRWAQRVSEFNLEIANKRADVHHKISRALVEGCDIVGIGDWEPVREVSYRKRLKAVKKEVKQGIAGASEKLKALEEEKSKQGPKGVRKQRRGGRDRGIATLRRLVKEKSERAGTLAKINIRETGSTMTCCVCGYQTGPKKDLSIREWKCEKCNTLHNRDLNSGFNILMKTEQEIASAQEAARETVPTVTRTKIQGATRQEGRKSDLRATGSLGSGDTFFYGHAGIALPNLWNEEVPKALKSLIEMKIVRSLSMQTSAETGSGTPP